MNKTTYLFFKYGKHWYISVLEHLRLQLISTENIGFSRINTIILQVKDLHTIY